MLMEFPPLVIGCSLENGAQLSAPSIKRCRSSRIFWTSTTLGKSTRHLRQVVASTIRCVPPPFCSPRLPPPNSRLGCQLLCVSAICIVSRNSFFCEDHPQSRTAHFCLDAIGVTLSTSTSLGCQLAVNLHVTAQPQLPNPPPRDECGICLTPRNSQCTHGWVDVGGGLVSPTTH